jgi:hypothetical protein
VQACQRAEHTGCITKTSGIKLGTGDIKERAHADADAIAFFNTSRLHQIVPGFYAGAR